LRPPRSRLTRRSPSAEVSFTSTSRFAAPAFAISEAKTSSCGAALPYRRWTSIWNDGSTAERIAATICFAYSPCPAAFGANADAAAGSPAAKRASCALDAVTIHGSLAQ